MKRRNIAVGTLLITLFAASVLIVLQGSGLSIDVSRGKTDFFTTIEGQRIISGTEQNILLLNNRVVSTIGSRTTIETNAIINSEKTPLTNDIDINSIDLIEIKRVRQYRQGPVITDIYLFDPTTDDITLFPVNRTVIIDNAEGYTYRYSLSNVDLLESPRTYVGIDRWRFGKQMELEVDRTDYILARTFNRNLHINYPVSSNSEVFNIRLFDPPYTITSRFDQPVSYVMGPDWNTGNPLGGNYSVGGVTASNLNSWMQNTSYNVERFDLHLQRLVCANSTAAVPQFRGRDCSAGTGLHQNITQMRARLANASVEGRTVYLLLHSANPPTYLRNESTNVCLVSLNGGLGTCPINNATSLQEHYYQAIQYITENNKYDDALLIEVMNEPNLPQFFMNTYSSQSNTGNRSNGAGYVNPVIWTEVRKIVEAGANAALRHNDSVPVVLFSPADGDLGHNFIRDGNRTYGAASNISLKGDINNLTVISLMHDYAEEGGSGDFKSSWRYIANVKIPQYNAAFTGGTADAIASSKFLIGTEGRGVYEGYSSMDPQAPGQYFIDYTRWAVGSWYHSNGSRLYSLPAYQMWDGTDAYTWNCAERTGTTRLNESYCYWAAVNFSQSHEFGARTFNFSSGSSDVYILCSNNTDGVACSLMTDTGTTDDITWVHTGLSVDNITLANGTTLTSNGSSVFFDDVPTKSILRFDVNLESVEETFDLIFSYPMDLNTSNSTVTNDTSGNNRHGTVNGATLMTNDGVYYSFDGINDYIASGYTTTVNSSWSISLWAKRASGSACSTQDIFVKGWDYRIYIGGTCNLNFITGGSNGTDVSHFTAQPLSDTTWSHIVYLYNASANQSQVYVNNVLITTRTQVGIDITANEYRIGGAGNSGTYFNGSIDLVTFYDYTLSVDNISSLYTTGRGNSLQINLTNNLIRIYPEYYRGHHDAGLTGYPRYMTLANGSTLIRNTTRDRELWEDAELSGARRDIDLRNLAIDTTNNSVCNLNNQSGCDWEIINTTNFQNINQHRDWVLYHQSIGSKVHIIVDAPPRWLANGSNECNYAPPAPDFSNYTTCMPNNFTKYGDMVMAYLNYTGCLNYSGLCYLEGDNEPYGSGDTYSSYFLSNKTAVPNEGICTIRSQRNIEQWNNTMGYIIDTLGRGVITYLSPSFTVDSSGSTARSECSRYMMSQFMIAFPENSSRAPEYMNLHEYESSSSCNLGDRLIAAQNNVTAGGYSRWMITESECNNAVVNANKYQSTALLTRAFITGLTKTNLNRHYFYVWSSNTVNAETYQAYSPTELDNFIKGSYYVHNTTKWLPQNGNIYDCVSSVSNFNCLYVEKDYIGYLILNNVVNSTINIDSIVSPNNRIIINATRLSNGLFNEEQLIFNSSEIQDYSVDGLETSIIRLEYFVATTSVSVDFSSIISIITGYRGSNTHPYPLGYGCRVGNSSAAGELQNCTVEQQRAWFLEAQLDIARKDLSFGDTAPTSPGSNNFTQSLFTTFLQSNYASAPLANNSSAWLGSQNKIIFWDADTTPDWNDNNTFCTGFKTCPALNLTQKENMVYAWLNYTRAELYNVWVGGKNEPYSVNPPFFLNALSSTDRCNATNYPIVRDIIVRENNATFNAVDRFNNDRGANVKKVISGPYTFENGTSQERCALNMTIDVINILSSSHPNMWMQIHDYYNNNEPDANNSFEWLGQRNAMWEAVKPLISIDESRIILGETGNYDNNSMCLNNDKLYADNLNILLGAIHPDYVANNWTIINFEWTSTGPRSVECVGGSRYYNMVSDPVLDNETTRIFDAYKHVGVTHPRGNTVVSSTDGDEVIVVCSKNSTSRTCSVSNIGSEAKNITVNVTLSDEVLVSVENLFTEDNYTFTENSGVYSISLGVLNEYEAAHIELNTNSIDYPDVSVSVNFSSTIKTIPTHWFGFNTHTRFFGYPTWIKSTGGDYDVISNVSYHRDLWTNNFLGGNTRGDAFLFDNTVGVRNRYLLSAPNETCDTNPFGSNATSNIIQWNYATAPSPSSTGSSCPVEGNDAVTISTIGNTQGGGLQQTMSTELFNSSRSYTLNATGTVHTGSGVVQLIRSNYTVLCSASVGSSTTCSGLTGTVILRLWSNASSNVTFREVSVVDQVTGRQAVNFTYAAETTFNNIVAAKDYIDWCADGNCKHTLTLNHMPYQTGNLSWVCQSDYKGCSAYRISDYRDLLVDYLLTVTDQCSNVNGLLGIEDHNEPDIQTYFADDLADRTDSRIVPAYLDVVNATSQAVTQFNSICGSSIPHLSSGLVSISSTTGSAMARAALGNFSSNQLSSHRYPTDLAAIGEAAISINGTLNDAQTLYNTYSRVGQIYHLNEFNEQNITYSFANNTSIYVDAATASMMTRMITIHKHPMNVYATLYQWSDWTPSYLSGASGLPRRRVVVEDSAIDAVQYPYFFEIARFIEHNRNGQVVTTSSTNNTWVTATKLDNTSRSITVTNTNNFTIDAVISLAGITANSLVTDVGETYTVVNNSVTVPIEANTTMFGFFNYEFEAEVSICNGVSSVVWRPDSRIINFPSVGEPFLSGVNQTPIGLSNCVYNVTTNEPTTLYVSTYPPTTANQRIYCGNSLATKVEVNITPVAVYNASSDFTVGCWMDYINTTPSVYREFSIESSFTSEELFDPLVDWSGNNYTLASMLNTNVSFVSDFANFTPPTNRNDRQVGYTITWDEYQYFTDDSTVSFWINPSECAASGTNTGLFGRDYSTIPANSHATGGILTNLCSFVFGVRNTSGVTISSNAGVADIGQWNHFVGMINNSVLYVYKNGVLADSDALTFPVATVANPNPFAIGTHQYGGNRHAFNGSIDDFRIWDRALTQAEITSIYNNGTVLNGLVAWYPFTN